MSRWLAARKGAQYLALAPLPSLDHCTTFHDSPPLPSCIQFWSISPMTDPNRGDDSQDIKVSCRLVVCIDDGPVKYLKWTPLPSHDNACTWNSSCFLFPCDGCVGPANEDIRKLGVLGAITEPGDLRLYVIPHTHDLPGPNEKDASREPVFCESYVVLIYSSHDAILF
jgi:hypothetical protein